SVPDESTRSYEVRAVLSQLNADTSRKQVRRRRPHNCRLRLSSMPLNGPRPLGAFNNLANNCLSTWPDRGYQLNVPTVRRAGRILADRHRRASIRHLSAAFFHAEVRALRS